MNINSVHVTLTLELYFVQCNIVSIIEVDMNVTYIVNGTRGPGYMECP